MSLTIAAAHLLRPLLVTGTTASEAQAFLAVRRILLPTRDVQVALVMAKALGAPNPRSAA